MGKDQVPTGNHDDHVSAGPWRATLIVGILGVVAAVVIAAATGLWVLTAAPIGFLFGFFLEKSDLCGSSAFSEVIMMKDTRKLEGLWVIIATSMVMFAIGSELGWIRLAPKPFIWANDLVGGAIFGVGIVLAGGCVSGTLFKSGQGNLNSMAALVGIPIGVSAVAYGPLNGFAKSLKQHVITSADGKSVTLASLTGLPYWLLAVIIAGATLAIALFIRRRRRARLAPHAGDEKESKPIVKRVLTRPWKPWHSGIAIGVLALAAYVSSAESGRNYPLGVTHGVLDVLVLATDYPVHSVYKKQPAKAVEKDSRGHKQATHKPRKHVVWWLVILVVCLVLGSHVSARLRGRFSLKPKPPDEIIVAFFGGILTGAGAAIAGGCVVGNIMSGVALMSVGNMLFFITVVLANWATTRLYMVGFGR